MTKAHVVVNLVDADGCIYNHYYFILRVWLAVEHFDLLLELAREAKQRKAPLKTFSDTALKIRQLMIDLQSVRLAQFDNKNYVNELYWNFYQHMQEFPRSFEDKIVHKQQVALGNLQNIMEEYEEDIRSLLQAIDPILQRTILKVANTQLINQLQVQQEKADFQLLANDSFRQSRGADQEGASTNLTGSVFEDVCYLTQCLRSEARTRELHINVLPLTLPDIQNNLKRGVNFWRVMAKYTGNQDKNICDSSKLINVYAIAHDTACRHRTAKITINLFDDNPSIIEDLISTFTKYPALLPRNVTLVFHKYTGELVPLCSVHGEDNECDENYYENVRLLIKMAEEKAGIKSNMVNVAKTVDFDAFLAQRKRQCTLDPQQVQAEKGSYNARLAADFETLADESPIKTMQTNARFFSPVRLQSSGPSAPPDTPACAM